LTTGSGANSWLASINPSSSATALLLLAAIVASFPCPQLLYCGPAPERWNHHRRLVMPPSAAQRRAQHRIAQQLGELGFVLPGSVTTRTPRCGKRNCRCHADPPALHGPYISWTRKVAGKTVTRVLTDEQLRDYQPWFDNARRLNELTAELQALSLQIVDHDPRWDH
jgi:hypothetical protein